MFYMHSHVTHLNVADANVPLADYVKLLGVTLHSHLTFDNYVENVFLSHPSVSTSDVCLGAEGSPQGSNSAASASPRAVLMPRLGLASVST